MPGLAAAGFKPAVYTNFTTLANRRMILEDCVILKAGKSHWFWLSMLNCSGNRSVNDNCRQRKIKSNTMCMPAGIKVCNRRAKAKGEYRGSHRAPTQVRRNGFRNPSKTKHWE